jgi:hypothetical protein
MVRPLRAAPSEMTLKLQPLANRLILNVAVLLVPYRVPAASRVIP